MLFVNVCAGFIRLCYGVGGKGAAWGLLVLLVVLFILGVLLSLLIYPRVCVWNLGYAGVPITGHALRAEFGEGIVCVVLWEFTR